MRVYTVKTPWFGKEVLPVGTKVRFQSFMRFRNFDNEILEGIFARYPYGGYCILVDKDHWTTGVEWFKPLNLKRKIGVFR